MKYGELISEQQYWIKNLHGKLIKAEWKTFEFRNRALWLTGNGHYLQSHNVDEQDIYALDDPQVPMILAADHYQVVIEALIAVNFAFRAHHSPEIRAAFPLRDYLMEFGTVQCDIGRRTGKTHYVRSRVARCDDAVVTELPQLYEGLDHVFSATKHTKWVRSPGERIYNRIYIDEPARLIRERQIPAIIQRFARVEAEQPQTFILLGSAMF